MSEEVGVGVLGRQLSEKFKEFMRIARVRGTKADNCLAFILNIAFVSID